jgi:hypothetical protein
MNIQAARRFFPGRTRSDNPEVIISGINRMNNPVYETKTVPGRFFRVSPQCPQEVYALQMLETRVDKFAPAEGDGIIISAEALAKLDAK